MASLKNVELLLRETHSMNVNKFNQRKVAAGARLRLSRKRCPSFTEKQI